MPVFDAISAGYIIPTYMDVYVSQKEQEDGSFHPHYEWPGGIPLHFHPIEQAPNHPGNPGHKVSIPKWLNPWSISLPKGYSALYVPPMHRENKYFTVLPGIVDNDEYTPPVNFPFVLTDINFEGMIPAGTPMVQIIPFKRDSWEMVMGNQQDLKNQKSVTDRIGSAFFDAYKNKFRQIKEYK